LSRITVNRIARQAIPEMRIITTTRIFLVIGQLLGTPFAPVKNFMFLQIPPR
jgi:hypothetical protein